MSYVANKYNYSTPLQSSVGLVNETSVVEDRKYFVLSDNVLDGSYFPISGDVGLWGASASNADGTLLEPFVVTVNENNTINAFRLTSSQYNYPVAFTVQFYNGDTLLHTITETANDKAEYINYLSKTLVVTHYIITVTKVSHDGSAARIYNVYDPDYVRRSDRADISVSETSEVTYAQHFSRRDTLVVSNAEEQSYIAYVVQSTDTLAIKEASESSVGLCVISRDDVIIKESPVSTVVNTVFCNDIFALVADHNVHIKNTIGGAVDVFRLVDAEMPSHIKNIINTTYDSALVAASGDSYLINVHARMKEPSRRIYGKVYITYTDPMLDSETTISTNMEAYNSNKDQVMDGLYVTEGKLFTLYDNVLDGSFTAMSEHSQVGWVSGIASDQNGNFSEVPYLRIDFATRAIMPLTLHFDDSHGCVAEDFTVEFIHDDDTSTLVPIVGNASSAVQVNNEAISAKTIIVRVTKVTKPNFPVVILEVPVTSTFLYRGYDDVSDLMSIDLLEELTYDDEIEALGGVSANEATIVLDNSHGEFYFNNTTSAVARQLRRNRKIEPWLGVEVSPGEIEWYKQGTYWSYRWNVPVGNLTATVVGFDTIGLLGTTTFEEHYMYQDKSLGELIDIVLTDAKKQLDFLQWSVDPALYDVAIPFAWFDPSNHAAALRKISHAYPMHIYCDKEGIICAAPQKLHLDYYYDTWSDSTNVISKEYGSLYTALPNLVNIEVHIPQTVENSELVSDTLLFDVSTVSTRKLNFSHPYISDIVVTIDKDSTVNYSYKVYSWGIDITFTGTGNVRSIKCTGTALDVSNTAVLTRRDESSIRLNGTIPREVKADFIQTSSLAQLILDRIFSLSTTDKYDATVMYRGDIALSINDPILLLDGIAPDNRYNIRRHQLFWNGALTGIADLNT